MYLGQVILLINQLLNDTKVIGVLYILQGHVKSCCFQNLQDKRVKNILIYVNVCYVLNVVIIYEYVIYIYRFTYLWLNVYLLTGI